MIQIAARTLGSWGRGGVLVPVSSTVAPLVSIPLRRSLLHRGALWPVGTMLRSTCSASPAARVQE